MSILLEVVCSYHPRYRAIRYPRVNCAACLDLYRMKHGYAFGIKTITAGDNK